MIATAFSAGLVLPDLRPLNEWAEENISIPDSYISKKFISSNAPFLIEPLNAWNNPVTWSVSVLAGVQGGKTLIEQVAVARAMASAPGNILITCQTDAEANFYNRTKLIPTLKASPATRSIVSVLGREDITKEHIILPGMFVQVQGPSLGGLQSKTIPYLLNDEVWRFPDGTMGELIRRTSAVRNRKVLSVSQGGEERENKEGQRSWDEWGNWYFNGTCEVFHVSCPHCQGFFSPELKTPDGKYVVVWDENESTRNLETKQWNWRAVRATVRLECPHCGARIENKESERRKLVQKWKYVPTNENATPGHRSFRYSGFALWWRDWADLVELWLRAQDALRFGQIEPLKAFIQKEQAEFWTLKDREIPIVREKNLSGYTLASYLPDAEGNIPKWESECERFMGVDMQKDCFPIVIRAYGQGKSRLVWAGKVYTFDEIEDKRVEYGIESDHVLIDCGFRKHDVLRECFLRGWVPTRGADQRSFKKTVRGRNVNAPWQWFPEILTGETIFHARYRDGERIRVLNFSNLYYKDILARLKGTPDFAIPDDIQDFYLESMESERKDSKGIWREYRRNKNHWLDGEVICLLAAHFRKLAGAPQEEEEALLT